MLFTDKYFLFCFLPVALVLHRLARIRSQPGPYPAAARWVLIVTTVIFYGGNHPWYLIPFFITLTGDCCWAILLARSRRRNVRRIWLGLSLFQNLGMLVYFKYFARELPPGISFYTFESLSFVIDFYRRRLKTTPSPLTLLTFLAMFPRFIAGPIVRFPEIQRQLTHYRGENLAAGWLLFGLGLGMKVTLADPLAPLTNLAFRPDGVIPTFLSAWLGLISYALQIYLDFNGYSLMAIGLGRMFGFDFPENFRTPYLATTLGDFWRRWHISLSTWLRDYVYVPLGGNRHGSRRRNVAIFTTMALGGIWHGGTWNFLAWGLWHGGFLVAERHRSAGPSRARVLVVVGLGWIWFRAPDLATAARVVGGLAGLGGGLTAVPVTIYPSILTLTAGLVYCFIVEPHWRARGWFAVLEPSFLQLEWATIAAALGAPVANHAAAVPFLYFQF